MYLGRALSFGDWQDIEIENQIDAAWRKYAKHKADLACKRIALKDRLKLFEAVVTPSVLYAS
eukprot:7507876-Karenia_brevis.AAC.1